MTLTSIAPSLEFRFTSAPGSWICGPYRGRSDLVDNDDKVELLRFAVHVTLSVSKWPRKQEDTPGESITGWAHQQRPKNLP